MQKRYKVQQSIQIEIRDTLFYSADSETEIWNLANIAETVFSDLEIEIYDTLLLEDTLVLVVAYQNFDVLLRKYQWEVHQDELVYVFLEGAICGSDASRIVINYVPPKIIVADNYSFGIERSTTESTWS